MDHEHLFDLLPLRRPNDRQLGAEQLGFVGLRVDSGWEVIRQEFQQKKKVLKIITLNLKLNNVVPCVY